MLAALWCHLAPALVLQPGDPRLSYTGRHLVNASVARFDWVGSGVRVRLPPSSESGAVAVDMDGGGNRFAVFVNGAQTSDFFAPHGAGRRSYPLAASKAAFTRCGVVTGTVDGS